MMLELQRPLLLLLRRRIPLPQVGHNVRLQLLPGRRNPSPQQKLRRSEQS
jgi:hypothetical protein